MAQYAIREKTTYSVVRTRQKDGKVGSDEPLALFDSVHNARRFIATIQSMEGGRPFNKVPADFAAIYGRKEGSIATPVLTVDSDWQRMLRSVPDEELAAFLSAKPDAPG